MFHKLINFAYPKLSVLSLHLKTLASKEQRLSKLICAYHYFGMHKSVRELPICYTSSDALIASIASHLACGEHEKAQKLMFFFERRYPQKVVQLLENIYTHDENLAIQLIQRHHIHSPIAIALAHKYHPLDQAIHLVKTAIAKHKGKEQDSYTLLLTNLSLHTPIQKLKNINSIYEKYGLEPLSLKSQDEAFNINNIQCTTAHSVKKQGLVSIIMTAFNSSTYIRTAIESLLQQSYQNIELIIIDDCSTDDTWQIIQSYCQKDARIVAYQHSQNCGTYVAKNFALTLAQGEFVLCHDSDDWSHPQRLQHQLQPLFDQPELIATTSDWFRLSEQGEIYARNIFPLSRLNPSSLLFRKKAVMQKVGFWDTVKTGADSEFNQRVKLTFGEVAILKVKIPLTIGSHHADSLMNAPETGFISQQMPENRLNYWESWNKWHIEQYKVGKDFYLPMTQVKENRKFPAPESILIFNDNSSSFSQCTTQ